MLTTSSISAQVKGNKEVTIIETQVNAYNTIELGDDFEVVLQESSTPAVEIETDSNLHDVIQFTVTDSVLRLKYLDKIRSKKRLNIKLFYDQALQTIKLKDDAEITANNSIKNKLFRLDLSDGTKASITVKVDSFTLHNANAKAMLNVTAKHADVNLSGKAKVEALINTETMTLSLADSADAEIEGNVQQLHATLNNNTDLIGKNLSVSDCNVELIESSKCSIEVIDTLTLKASGSSETRLYGTPKISINTFANTSKLLKKEK